MVVKNLILKAKRNDADAQFLLAKAYLEGEHIRRNISKAIKWLEIASDNNHAKASMRLGELYWCGHGKIQVDEFRALSLFTKAAKLGLVRAQYLLGSIKATDETHYDLSESVSWYKLAAESGDPGALHNLGVMYQLGEGVEQDEKKGALLLAEAEAILMKEK